MRTFFKKRYISDIICENYLLCMYLFTKLKKKGRNIFNHIQWKHVLGRFN